MKVDVAPEQKKTGDLVPWDLAEWIDPPILINWIVEEIETLDWHRPEVVELLAKHPQFRPKEILAVLTYGYVTKTYESDLICDLAETERHVANVVKEVELSPDLLLRFRKENKGILRWLIMKVFKRALWHHHQITDSDFIPAGLKQYFAEAANARLDLARHFDRSGAQ